MNGPYGVLMTRRFFIAISLFWIGFYTVTAFAETGAKPPSASADVPDSLQSVLEVVPREIDLGTLGPGEEARGAFYLKIVGSETPEWFAEGPKGWTLIENQSPNKDQNQNFSGIIGRTPEHLRIRIVNVREIGTSKKRACSVVLHLEAAGHAAAFHRDVPVGDLREEIRLSHGGETVSVFFQVRLVALATEPQLDLEPLRMDFGTIRPGEQITKRILLKNKGREPLTWKTGVAGGKGMPSTAQPLVGQYVSFRSETAGAVAYPLSGLQQEGLELSGNWEDEGGYPSGQGEQNVLRYRFSGMGINLYFWKSPDGGPFSVYLDEQFVTLVDGHAERRERGEALVFEGQIEGPHLLTIVNGAGKLTLEGVRILGKSIQKGPRGWITLFPDSGFTTRETDFINVAINARQLAPGIYGDHVFFASNGGEADVEVFLEVAAETTPRFLNVHRYLTGSDYLYTTNPQAEASRLRLKGYRLDGIVFRLFAPGTPGTTDFFRWFNPSKGDHYYSHDPKGGKPLPGYLFEGAIGNIATSRLTGTRELYLWFNPAKGGHFYTTEQAGEGLAKKGYRFEGIVGFVR